MSRSGDDTRHRRPRTAAHLNLGSTCLHMSTQAVGPGALPHTPRPQHRLAGCAQGPQGRTPMSQRFIPAQALRNGPEQQQTCPAHDPAMAWAWLEEGARHGHMGPHHTSVAAPSDATSPNWRNSHEEEKVAQKNIKQQRLVQTSPPRKTASVSHPTGGNPVRMVPQHPGAVRQVPTLRAFLNSSARPWVRIQAWLQPGQK